MQIPTYALKHILSIAALALVGCGGRGSGSSHALLSLETAQQCASNNMLAPASFRTGSLSAEKQWVRSYVDQAYLWYDQVPRVDASAAAYSTTNVYESLDNYFEALKTTSRTLSGAYTDRFSFISSTQAWQDLSNSGLEAGYGIEWHMASRTAPRGLRIAYIQPGSTAEAQGLKRGDVLITADGVSGDVESAAGIDTLNAALSPSIGTSHALVFRRSDVFDLTVTLQATNVTKTPVLSRSVITAADGAKVGYIAFTDHIAPAEAQLIEAVNYLKGQNVSDLVLDIRYNGGGYLYIASELAYMIAGPTTTQNKVFEKLTYNSKRSAETNDKDSSTPFFDTSCILDSNQNCSARNPLPTLNLSKVYVITKSGTCSASEAIINGLRGVDVDVRQIGSTTCGKPYGFTAKDNCGISYFPIEFKGANAKGFGDYSDGFIPGGTGPTALPGCVVSDDFSKALGDASEGMLAATLDYRATGVCPPLSKTEQPQQAAKTQTALGDGFLLRSPGRENRILLPLSK